MNDGQGFLPFETARILVRSLRADDAPTILAYRNHPEVSRYQDWQLPYPAERAQRLVEEMAGRTDLAHGRPLQLGLEVGGELIGDLYAGIDDEHGLATIGYTLRAEFQGHGYATEAVGALVDRLFEHIGVHRIAATLDPVNQASARLLERLGFRYDGCSPSAVHIRGEWVDDARYALLRDEWIAWKNRPRTPPSQVRLVEITDDDAHLWQQVVTHKSQEQFVSPVVRSYRDAYFAPELNGMRVVPWMRGIEADGERVGFVMMAEVTSAHPDPFIWRLLIDRFHQRRGIGHIVLQMLIDDARAAGHRRLVLDWHPGHGTPEPFYRAHGFVPTGETDGDEIVAALNLATQ